MRTADITFVAWNAANTAAGRVPERPDQERFTALHAYALARRDIDAGRRFPSPEVLARKHAEMSGRTFGFASIDAATRDMRIFWQVFRANIEALDPFRDDAAPARFGDDAASLPPDDTELDRIKKETGIMDSDELTDMANVGTSLMAAIAAHAAQDGPLKGYAPAQDPAEIVGDLVEMLAQRDRATEAPPADDPDPTDPAMPMGEDGNRLVDADAGDRPARKKTGK